ncbi:MAG TPA: 3-hydroxyacyl-CoA dehydrogenase family protein [Thermoleophilaceae bacterium]|nr:3-hydroxyacyl-CoA dehydrogenase family protein [Thermoleophilaceae bacterium]
MTERIGIVGSGAIATGIARAAAEHGDVVLWARSEASAERARDAVEAEVYTDLDALSDRSLVIEAVVEDQAEKAALYARLRLADDALLASTTSSLSVAELGRASGRPDRFGGLHFFNPVHRMELVELAFPPEATDDTRGRLRAFCEHLDKTPIEVADVPGFVVNRLLFPYLFSAVALVEDGMPPEAVDTCMKLGAGHPMGPLALLDFVGIDVAIAIGESIGAEVPGRLRELAAAGRFGKKSGAGFYEY